jgi:hypothetical protein
MVRLRRISRRTTIHFLKLYGTDNKVRKAQTAQKGCFCVRNGLVTPSEEGFAKQTQVMHFEGWPADDVTAEAYPVSIKLEALLGRYSWKKVLQNYSRISYDRDGRRMSRNHDVISRSAACDAKSRRIDILNLVAHFYDHTAGPWCTASCS